MITTTDLERTRMFPSVYVTANLADPPIRIIDSDVMAWNIDNRNHSLAHSLAHKKNITKKNIAAPPARNRANNAIR